MPSVIALDAQGGDFSPRVPVKAALRFSRHAQAGVLLVGDLALLEPELARWGESKDLVQLVHAPLAVSMADAASSSLRKDKSGNPLLVGFDLVKAGRAQALVSMGNSGAVMVAGKHVLGTLPGVERPALATVLPLSEGGVILLDSGANVDCKPRYLLQFARMGSQYARIALGVEQPRVGLLNIGVEPGKGNELARKAFDLLETGIAGFVGNIEPAALFRGKADVVVCDGFAGNLVLKTAEAASRQTRRLLKAEAGYAPLRGVGLWMLANGLRRLGKRTDPRAIGGSLLMGLNGTALICHGASNIPTVVSALEAALNCVNHDLTGIMTEELERETAKASPLGNPGLGSTEQGVDNNVEEGL